VFKNLLKRPWAIRRRLAWGLTAVNVVGTLVFATLSYQTARKSALADIDDNLCSAAQGIQQIVPPLIINQAEADERSEPQFTDAYRASQTRIESYVEAARLDYTYAIAVRVDGSAYELISNLSPEQQAERVDPLKDILLKPYELSPIMIESAKTGDRRIDVAEDEYGYFRSCLIPVKTTNGEAVLFGADMEISAINDRLFRDLIANVGIGFGVLIGMLIIIRMLSSAIARELLSVVRETEAVSRLVFLNNETRARSNTLEIDQLFGALFDMKNGLRAFSKYVPTAVVTQVLGSGKAEIGGERRELSLLMTDVTDFTTISEQLEPERVMIVMSEYFDRVVAPILAAQGTLDKYVGDAIFAYWNAPARQTNHALLCCSAALAAREASNVLAKEWEDMGRWAWRTRFGLHAGETVFGNVGAPDRMDFTVIGSSVNLASRIEGLNKFYGTEILASDRIRKLAGDDMVFRRVDLVLPKGALDAFEIYELLGDKSILANDEVTREYLQGWADAHALFKQRRWAQALVAFSALAIERPQDRVAKRYVQRCKDFVTHPPSVDWDGVQSFESK
jgi:class 3 adenylate cyclase